jgi:uncharacterized membrane protein YqjE
MVDSWVRRILKTSAWIGALVKLLDLQWQSAAVSLRFWRKNLLIALCLAVMGAILAAVSITAFAVMLVMVWWQDYPLQSLGGVSLLCAAAAIVLVQRSIRRLS